MSADCVSSADNPAWAEITARSVANAKAAIVFMLRVLLSDFMAASRLAEFAKLLRCFDVAPRPPGDILLLIERKLPANFRGRPEDERARRNLHAASDERVCSYDRTRADFYIVKNDGTHPDKHFIVDLARVHDRVVANRDQLTHDRGIVCIKMHDGIVLNVRARADNDAIDIAAQNGAVPHARFLFKCNVANNGCSRDNPCARMNCGPFF